VYNKCILNKGSIEKIKLTDNNKIIQNEISISLSSLVIFFFLLFNNEKLISRIIFDFYYISIENYFISFFITWLCVMLLLNAINLYDGINGQLATYAIFVFAVFLYKNIFYDLSFFILFFLLFFLYYNLRGKIFLGDNGSFLIGFVIAFIVISNNSTANYLTGEKIFLLMFLPGIDMFRLFVERLINKKNPFIADSSHVHHLFIKKFSEKKLHFFNIPVYVLPIILSYKMNGLLLIIILIILYLLFIYKYLGHTLKK
jgi:UDP-GlcNAc:undecaprenyl-phosphate GlcNAc-1-phosphate transferase